LVAYDEAHQTKKWEHGCMLCSPLFYSTETEDL
jgi:hypothetical protein